MFIWYRDIQFSVDSKTRHEKRNNYFMLNTFRKTFYTLENNFKYNKILIIKSQGIKDFYLFLFNSNST